MIPAAKSLRATLATIGTACALALVPAAAHADQYVVDHCQTPDGKPAVVFPAVTGQTSDNCSAPGGGLHHQEGTSALPNSGDVRQIVLTIPADRPNLRIERVISTFSMPGGPPDTVHGGGNGFAFLNMRDGNDVLVYNTNGSSGTTLRPTLDLTLPPNDRRLTWEVLCGGSTCTFFEGNILNVYGNRLYLNEGVAPTLNVTGGTLSGPGAKRGRMTLGFDAADPDSGVSSASVTLGGVEVGAVQFACAFKDWSACPREQLSQLLTADTTKVPDGKHELVVTVRDAANNALTRSLGVVTVANGGVSVPNGANPSRLAKITARFTSTKRTSRLLRLGSTPTVRGTLVNEQGQAITGATVALLARQRKSGAQPVQIATAQTGADGGFSTKLPGGPSRTITFAYTAFSADAKPATTATLSTSVRAIVSATISPRSVRAGKRMILSGALALLPRAGVEVKLQARQGRTWSTVGDVKTTRGGKFRWSYRFRPSQRGRTFSFRARVASPIYPFAAGNSKTLKVHVR